MTSVVVVVVVGVVNNIWNTYCVRVRACSCSLCCIFMKYNVLCRYECMCVDDSAFYCPCLSLSVITQKATVYQEQGTYGTAHA